MNEREAVVEVEVEAVEIYTCRREIITDGNTLSHIC